MLLSIAKAIRLSYDPRNEDPAPRTVLVKIDGFHRSSCLPMCYVRGTFHAYKAPVFDEERVSDSFHAFTGLHWLEVCRFKRSDVLTSSAMRS